MKINDITVQAKGQHPGVLVSYLEGDRLVRTTLGTMDAALDFVTKRLVRQGRTVDDAARMVWAHITN